MSAREMRGDAFERDHSVAKKHSAGCVSSARDDVEFFLYLVGDGLLIMETCCLDSYFCKAGGVKG